MKIEPLPSSSCRIRKMYKDHGQHPGNILKFLHRSQDALKIPRFKLPPCIKALLRSTAHAIGIPDSYIMQSGGWQSDNVLKSVYRHALDEEKEKMQKQAAKYSKDIKYMT